MNVGIVGAGFMGAGIAETVAASELPVTLYEPDARQLESADARIGASLDVAVQKGKLQAAEAGAILDRIVFTDDLTKLADVDVAIEAVPEELEVKRKVFAELHRVVGESTMLASNTSSIPIAQLASAVTNPERVVGLHFFSPVPVMKLVEIVRALDTSDETVRMAEAFCERLHKRPIVTRDRSGFIVNLLLVPYLMAAVRMYEEGFATQEAIDDGMRLGCGHPMGPLALCDLIGLDVLYSVCDSLYEEFKRPEYAPPPLMKRMVAAGRLGRKTGRGFYEYPPKG